MSADRAGRRRFGCPPERQQSFLWNDLARRAVGFTTRCGSRRQEFKIVKPNRSAVIDHLQRTHLRAIRRSLERVFPLVDTPTFAHLLTAIRAREEDRDAAG